VKVVRQRCGDLACEPPKNKKAAPPDGPSRNCSSVEAVQPCVSGVTLFPAIPRQHRRDSTGFL